MSSVDSGPIQAVIFDWGGTLTPWHHVDLVAQWRVYAQVYDDSRAEELATELKAAEDSLWSRQRRSKGGEGTGNLDYVFATAGIDVTDPKHLPAMAAYLDFWRPHTYADPDAHVLFTQLKAHGLRVGILSNTLWPRRFHEDVFARDGLSPFIDGAVYTSEIPHGKPHPSAFRAALDAVGVEDPRHAVFVGDRPWDDIHGAQQAGIRAILVPHSTIPADQQVPVDVSPDAIVQRLGDVLEVVRGWDPSLLTSPQ